MKRFAPVYAAVLMFSALAYSFWYDLLGVIGVSALLLALTAVTIAAIPVWRARLASAPRMPWRSQPWPVLLYAAFAALSITWSSWPLATAITWVLMALFTGHGILFARVFTGTELLTALERALGAIMVLSLAIEVWVGVVLRHPILPNFSDAPADPDPHWYWVRGVLFDDLLVGSRIQGIVGNANLLAALCAVALIVFAARFAQRAPHTGIRVVLTALTLWLCLRAGSVGVFVTLAALAATALVVLIVRRARTRRTRLVLTAVAGVLVVGAAIVFIALRDVVLPALGRSSTITGRTGIWTKVLDRAVESPVIGHGFASPWLPWDPAFDGWIMDHGITVFHSHNMWLDAFLQLGAIGVLLLLTIYVVTLWRGWRRAIHPDPSVRTMVPLLLALTLTVQGLTESAPLMFWGWMLISFLYTRLMPQPSAEGVQSGSGAPR